MANLLNMLFGCWHNKCSFPITTKTSAGRRSPAALATGTYVVCLDCGKEFPYDWNEMRMLSGSAQRRLARAHALEARESFATSNGRAA
ncbi:MAG: hypothetical protein ABI383_06680 [Acidobacteriaceae bacterium]